MAQSRFMGPYHATDIANFIKCPYSFKLTRVEGLPETHRHAAGIVGDAIHFILEALHVGKLDGTRWENLEDPEVAEQYFLATFNWLVENGNPRYPERSQLPIRWGRKREKDATGEKVSRPVTPEEFMEKYTPRAVQMLTGYKQAPFNGDIEGKCETSGVEIGFELVVARQNKSLSDGYHLMGRIDQLRKHYTLDTIPASIRDFDRLHPGAMDALRERLDKNGYLLELSDWKTQKDAPIFRNQKDPFVAFMRMYQHRIYALAIAEGECGEIRREVDMNGKVTETLLDPYEIGQMPDFITFHWLPGYIRREKGERSPEWAGRRAKKGEVVQYLPGKAPGDPMEPDPRYAIVVIERDLEAVRKDIRRVLGSIRLNQFYRNPGPFSCTVCQVAEECEFDMDVPKIRPKDMDAILDMEDDDEF